MTDTSLTIDRLERSAHYQVCQTFHDFYHNLFKEGEILTFVERSFLPYHGGHTIVFKEKTLYLHEDENTDILDSFGLFFRRVPKPPAREE